MIYAINKRTKEHRVVPLDDRIGSWMPEWETVGADADGWIPWNGGDCPLPDDARIKVMTRNGVEHRLPIHAGNQRWGHGGGQYDITAYRPVLDTEPAEPEAPEWDGDGECPPVGSKCMRDCDRVVILAHTNVGSPYDLAVVYQSLTEPDEIDWDVCNVFSPIRTAAQRSEEKAVEAMYPIIDEVHEGGPVEIARTLYRAIRDGKVPGVKLDNN